RQRAGDALPDGAVRRRVHRLRAPRAAAAARAGQRVHPGPAAGPVDAHPAELADLQGLDRPDAPAPGVPAEPGLRLLAIELRLPEHLPADHRPWAGRGPVDLRAAGGDGNDQEPLLRDAPSLVGRALPD